jgi:prepilin-type N-terminal cleavage/methylation domain-containing protein
MARPERGAGGFTLLEVAVVLAVLAILAGLFTPLATRTVARQREEASREGLRLAFEALVGRRDGTVPNLRSDCGFAPPAGPLANLDVLVGRSGIPAFGLQPGDSALLPWGWRGPYWLGPVRDGHPADAWGNPLQVEHRGGGVRVLSMDPARGPGAVRLAYPEAPFPLDSLQATLVLAVTPVEPAPAGPRYGCVGVEEPPGGLALAGAPGTRMRTVPPLAGSRTGAAFPEGRVPDGYTFVPEGSGNQTLVYHLTAGRAVVVVKAWTPGMVGRAWATSQEIALDCRPGETRVLKVAL